MPSDLGHYLAAFRNLKANRSGTKPSPHKPCMLLAVIGLAEAGQLAANEIRFEPPLLERYAKYFSVVKLESDHANPFFPYFHLRSEGFWHLEPVAGREIVVAALDSARSVAAITDNVLYAYVDEALHQLLLDSNARTALRNELVQTWFAAYADPLAVVLSEEERSDRYETKLRQAASGAAPGPDAIVPPEYVRDTAFRRVVSEVYDYRCAASGWRIVLPDRRAMVEAAHLVPFAVSHDDDPRNGIALAPSYHWALDAHVIAPGPDYQWHVSDALDDRFADNHPLLVLAGKSIILPHNKSMWPKRDALDWRVKHLLSR